MLVWRQNNMAIWALVWAAHRTRSWMSEFWLLVGWPQQGWRVGFGDFGHFNYPIGHLILRPWSHFPAKISGWVWPCRVTSFLPIFKKKMKCNIFTQSETVLPGGIGRKVKSSWASRFPETYSRKWFLSKKKKRETPPRVQKKSNRQFHWGTLFFYPSSCCI